MWLIIIIKLRPHTLDCWSEADLLDQIHQTSLLVRKGREGLWRTKEVWWIWSKRSASDQQSSVCGRSFTCQRSLAVHRHGEVVRFRWIRNLILRSFYFSIIIFKLPGLSADKITEKIQKNDQKGTDEKVTFVSDPRVLIRAPIIARNSLNIHLTYPPSASWPTWNDPLHLHSTARVSKTNTFVLTFLKQFKICRSM